MKEYICSDGNPVIDGYCYGTIVRNYKEPFLKRKGVFSWREVPPFIELYAARTINGELCLQPVMMDYPDCYEQFSPIPIDKVDLKKFIAIDLTAFKGRLRRGSMRYKDRNGIPILAGMCVGDEGGGNEVVDRKGVLCLNILEDYIPLSEINLKTVRVYVIPLKLYTEGNKNE